ncbi:MAG TPA: DUF2207 domain-containing protein [Tissierellaceae bacterium]|nr:DUF2207 domain-containing protein [Tissierellaceae bacterium]
MKKRLAIFVIILVLFISPHNVSADDLDINSWIVEAHLNDDGSLNIIKDISYYFGSDFNGVYVDIALDNIISIDNIQVAQVVNGEEREYTQDQKAKKGQDGVFSINSNNDNANIMIFSPSAHESKTFRLEYTLYNVAVIHSDTAELYYKFLGKNNETPIDYFSANIYLPQFKQDDINIFAHGPSNGNIFFDNQSIKLEVTNVPSNTFVEARVLFPLDYLPFASRTGTSSLSDILDEERVFINQIIEDEAKRQERISLSNNLSVGLSAIALLIFTVILRRFRRHPDLFNEMTSIYPDDISPAELSLFMNSIIGPRSYISTLLDFARKEYLSIETSKSKNDLKRSKDTNNYIFVKKDNYSGNLLSHEEYLIDWLFKDIADGIRVSTDDINYYRKKNPRRFQKSQTEWQKLVRDELKLRGFYDHNSKKYGIIGLIISLILITISVISLILGAMVGILLLVIGMVLLVYSIYLFQRKSDRGYIQHRLWKDFKKDNSNIDVENLGLTRDLSIIYLIALGLPMKDLNNYRQSIGMDYYPIYWGYYYFMMNSKGGSSFEDKFNNSFYGSAGTTTANSSSFGGGGGFTGGGGGGVGGSGSGGF